jgi:hypothetical protein
MKKLKQTIADIQLLDQDKTVGFTPLLWQYICYSPKMPVRWQQQQLLDDAQTSTLKVNDKYFAEKELQFNTFKWGTGTHIILLTHGWASKALDLSEIISALRQIDDLQIIAFDAPGNGSSEGDLSNLLLYVQAVKAVVFHYGQPAIMIGHSLGAMANIIASTELQSTPDLFISLTPLVRLKENFEASMDVIGISTLNQDNFLKSFKDKFGVNASEFTLNSKYNFKTQPNHWIAFDKNDPISPYTYLKEFSEAYPSITLDNYDGEGHYKILKSATLINDLMGKVNLTLKSENKINPPNQ